MRKLLRRWPVVVGLLGLALLAAACGGGSTPGGTPGAGTPGAGTPGGGLPGGKTDVPPGVIEVVGEIKFKVDGAPFVRYVQTYTAPYPLGGTLTGYMGTWHDLDHGEYQVVLTGMDDPAAWGDYTDAIAISFQATEGSVPGSLVPKTSLRDIDMTYYVSGLGEIYELSTEDPRSIEVTKVEWKDGKDSIMAVAGTFSGTLHQFVLGADWQLRPEKTMVITDGTFDVRIVGPHDPDMD